MMDNTPRRQGMVKETEAFYASLEEKGVLRRHTHRCQAREQWELDQYFLAQANGETRERWRDGRRRSAPLLS